MIRNSSEAITIALNLIEWLKESRDMSEQYVTDRELEALEYIVDTYNMY